MLYCCWYVFITQLCVSLYLCDRTHQGLQFESAERKVLDANVHDIDRYEIFDPRNPLTVRRREESKRAMQQKR